MRCMEMEVCIGAVTAECSSEGGGKEKRRGGKKEKRKGKRERSSLAIAVMETDEDRGSRFPPTTAESSVGRR